MLLIRRIDAFLKGYISGVQSKLSKRQFMMLSSVLVGLSAGLVAITLKSFAHYIFKYVTHSSLSNVRYFYLLLPAVGIFLSWFIVKRFFA
ncbi:MAG: chloride channel protein, partial [Crocinitomicaceae bacterium]